MRSLLLVLLALCFGSLVLGQSGDLNLQAKEPEQRHPLIDYFKNKGAFAALQFLKADSVQKELELTDAQKGKIVLVQKEVQESLANISKPNPTLSSDERRKKRGEVNVDLAKKLETILKPSQANRLLEIFTQFGGPVLLFPQTDLDKILEMNEDQKKTIKLIVDDVQETIRKAMTNVSPAADIQKQVREQFLKQQSIFKEANDRILKILTPKQLDILNKMKGKEIDTAKLFEEMADSMALPGH